MKSEFHKLSELTKNLSLSIDLMAAQIAALQKKINVLIRDVECKR